MADFPTGRCLLRVEGAPPLAGGSARRGWELDAKSWTLGMRRVGLPDVGDGQGDDGRQAFPMGTSFRRNWDRLINWGLAHTRQRGSSRHKLRRSMARAAGRRRSRSLRSPTEPRTTPSAAAKVAGHFGKIFRRRGGGMPSRAGRTQSAISCRTSSRWPLLTDGLASYQGKSVPCSSDFNSLFRRVGNFSANTLILLQPG